ncbi:MAG: hypothetical protein J1F22_05865 [Lachnospiraceae bacterium]|nr:hypothetical protein [Lachnospiraceae bacterium]
MIGKLQDLFISLFQPWIPVVGRLSDKTRYRIITGCFIADLVLFCIVRYVLHKESYFYNTVCGIVLMLAIAVFSLDRSLVRIHWRRSMWIAWFGMCISFTVSDLLLPKKVCGLGIILAFVFTGVFFVWQNHTRKDLLWKCFKDAVKYSFWLMAVISFLFRPLYEGGRYAGIFTNPNTFALYLYIIFAVYMSDLDWIVETGKNWKRCFPTYISLALVVFYLAMTQARTSMLAIGSILFLWIAFRIYLGKKNHSWKAFLKNLVLVSVISAVLYPVFFVGVTYLPRVVGHPITFPGETLYLANGSNIPDYGEVVIPESVGVESVGSGSGQPVSDPEDESEDKLPDNAMERFFYVLENTKGLNALTTGRIDIYKGYAKNLNYKGHKNISLVIDGKQKNHAHNNWLQFGYTYGILGMFFYGIITVLSVGFSLKFYLKDRRKNATYAFLIPAICIGFMVATMAECLFLPFEVFPAFAFWFAFEDLFVKKVPKNKFLQELEERE